MSDHFLVRCQWNGLLPRPPQLRHLLSQEIMPAEKHAVWVCNISAVSALRGPQSVSNDMGQHPVPEEPGLVPDPVTAWEGDNRAALEESRVAPSVPNRPDAQVYCRCIKNRWEQNQLGYSHVSQREGAVCIVFHQTVNDDWGWGGLMFLCCSTITYFHSTVWFTCAESNRNFALCHYSVGKIYKWTMLNYLHFTCTEPPPTPHILAGKNLPNDAKIWNLLDLSRIVVLHFCISRLREPPLTVLDPEKVIPKLRSHYKTRHQIWTMESSPGVFIDQLQP